MKNKILLLLLSAVLLAPCTSYAASVNGSGIVTADKLNIRKAPSTSSSVKSALYKGDKVDIITKTGEWYEILYSGGSYYVHSDYVTASRKTSGSEKPAPQKPYVDQSATGKEKAAAIVKYAKEFLGIPYLWGGTSPEEGFDCSGLVYYVYGQFDVKLYRVAADMQNNGTEVDREHLQPGDIVLFWNRDNHSTINHVGIYVGDGNFIHAPQTGDVVKITTLDSGYYDRTYYTARRIFE